MQSVYFSEELQCTLMTCSADEWLALQESVFFNALPNQEDGDWLFLDNAPLLSAYSALLTVAQVEGKWYKLNGLQRQIAWSSGQLAPPHTLLVQVIEFSAADFLALNQEVQSKQLATLPPNEVVKLIYAELGLSFQSARIREGFIVEALNIALRGKPRSLQDKRFIKEKEEIQLKKAIAVFSDELQLLDSLDLKAELFFTGVLAAALIMLGSHSPNTSIVEFLRRLNAHEGETKDGLEDPVAGLLRALDSHTMTDRNMSSLMSIELCKKTMQAILLWEEGKDSPKYWRKKLITGVDHLPYIGKLKHQKHIHDAMDL